MEAADINILFIGNSHTATHNVSGIVKQLLESAPSGKSVRVQYLGAASLKGADSAAFHRTIRNGGWNFVVLQGQEISMSHKYDYSKEEAIRLAKLAKDSGAKPLLFSEWKRRGVEETEYIEAIYRHIAKQSEAEVVPIGRAWDRALKQKPDAALWSSDNNHAAPAGAFLAAATIAWWIAGEDAEMTKGADPSQLDSDTAKWLLTVARDEVKEYRTPKGEAEGP